MSILSGFAFDGAEIRCTAEGQPSVFDMIRVIGGKKNPRDLWKRLCEQYPEVAGVCQCQFVSFPDSRGRRNKPTPVVTTKEGVELLQSLLGCRIGSAYHTSDKYFPRTETQIVRVLLEAFADQQPCPQFYCQGYRIDLYLAASRIAIEIDENSHRHYDKSIEQQREAAIKAALGCSFVRLNPHDPQFNLGAAIYKVRQLSL